MANPPIVTGTVDLTYDTRPIETIARTIATHLTALADDLATFRASQPAADFASAWSDYRSAFGADASNHKHFRAGWDAAHGIEHQGTQR